MPLKQDDGSVGKAAVGLAVVAGGIVAVVAYWKWQQNKKSMGKAPGEKPAPTPAAKGPATSASTSASKPTALAASKPAPAAVAASKAAPASPQQLPAASQQQSAAAQKEATVQKTEPVAKSVAPPPTTVPTVAAPPPKLATAPPATATTASLTAAAPPSPAAAKPRIPSGNDNGSDLSMSATFEKVSADPSLTLSSMSSMSASYSGTTTPPTGPGSKPPSMGGPKSEELHCDSSRESPVFGGQPFSMLHDSEAELSNFDPSKQHPAFFGFKFDGATS